MNTAAFAISEVELVRDRLGVDWHEFLKVSSLSMGLYQVAAGTTDKESHSPHDQDEIYVGRDGRGRLTADGKCYDIQAGSVVYVKSGVEHYFHDVTEDLNLLVFFASHTDA